MGRRILVTGAMGDIAGQVVPHLVDRHAVTLIDVDPARSSGGPIDASTVEALDIVADEDRLATLMEGHDAVLHLANRAAPGPLAHDDAQAARVQELYEVERANVDMMQTIYRLALQTGVRRVITASSNQAAKWYEEPYYRGLRQRVGPDDYPKPVSFYGWAKVSYESLGFLYASGALGRALEVVALRIVAPRPVRLATFVGQPTTRYFRDIAGYISRRDLAQLVERAIEVEDIHDQDGVPFLIVYGTSGNARRFWDLETACRVLGYAPLDDSEVEFATEIRAVLDDGDSTVTAAMVEAAGRGAD